MGLIPINLSFFGGGGGGGGFPNTEGGKDKFVKKLDDLLSDPSRLKNASPQEWYEFLKNNGHNPQPLSGGSQKGISFESGGGFKVTWGGDRILQFHPGSRYHGGAPYWKISSGPTGTIRYDLHGNIID